MRVRDMLIACQSVADEHRVGFVGIESAIGLVGNLERSKHAPAIERQSFVASKDQTIAR